MALPESWSYRTRRNVENDGYYIYRESQIHVWHPVVVIRPSRCTCLYFSGCIFLDQTKVLFISGSLYDDVSSYHQVQ